MKKNIFSIFLAIFLLLNSQLEAQLSGNYTIGGTTSSTNFATWSDFATAFNNNGVSGAVNVNVMSNLSLSATLQLIQHSTNPTTSSNTLTINGNNKTLTGSPTYELIWLNGSDFVKIKNLNLIHSGTSSNIQGIRFSNGANDNIIDSCSIEFSAMNSTNIPNGAYIAFASSNSSLKTISTTHNGMRNTIKNSVFKTSSLNAPGPEFGIIDQQGSSYYSSVSTSNTFSNNAIKNFYSCAFFVKYVNGEQIISNDISRENATSSSLVDTGMLAIKFNEVYTANKLNYIGKNTIHDLPYKGSTPSNSGNYIGGFTGIELFNCYGTTTYPITISSNKFISISFASYFNGIINESVELITVSQNEFALLNGLNGNSAIIYANNSADIIVTGNHIKKCDFGSTNSGSFFGFYFSSVSNKNYNENLIEANTIDSVYAANEGYGFIAMYDGNWVVSRNQLTSNQIVSSSSVFYGTFFYYLQNLTFVSNLVAKNSSQVENYSFWDVNYYSGYSLVIKQNTVYMRESNSGLNSYGFYSEDESSLTFEGNIVDMKGLGNGTPAYLYSSTAVKLCNNNTFNVSIGSTQSWFLGGNSYTSFSGWKGSSDVGPNENFLNPNFNDIAKNDFRSNCFETQNSVPYQKGLDYDVVNNKRNSINSDRGSFENFMDLKLLKSDLNVSGQICSGAEKVVSVFIKNTFSDTAYNFYIAYSVNGKLVRQKVTQKILSGDSQKITFNVPMTFVNSGLNIVRIFIELGDDNTSNDTLKYSANITASPGGNGLVASSKITTPNTAVYQSGRNFDVTINGTPVYYDLKAPRLYSNSSFGASAPKNWFVSVQAQTKGGKLISGATFTNPSTTTDLEVKFLTSDSTLEDSFVYVKVKVTDVNTGCDTTYKRMIFISPSPRFNFGFPSKICSNDTVNIKNNTALKSGYLNYSWNFGTGNTADTSNSLEPSFIFKSGGTYNVSLTAISSPYYFVFNKSYSIGVISRPSISFTKENACIGNDLSIVNNTVPSTSTMTWDFGDGNGTSINNKSSFVIRYSKSGTYNVKLTSSNNGCISSSTQKIIVFDKPIPDFTRQSGKCDNEKIVFANNTNSGSSNFGSKWDFDDNGKTSVDKNPTYTFSTPGTKNVKLIVLSEFGCKDSITKAIGIKESPKVSFTHSQFCAISKTEFINTTPQVSGTAANVLWDFSDGNTSSSDNVSYKWPSIGKKTISLTVTLDNGCIGKLAKDIEVLDEPTANFIFQDRCSNDTVMFDNKSVGIGSLSYFWDFGDNDSSKLEKPFHVYHVPQNKTFNVTLTVKIAGGCSATLIKQINVYELPRTCDFEYTPDYSSSYYGAKLEPKDNSGIVGGQNNIDYNWNLVGFGNQTSKDVNAAVYYSLSGDGAYTVSMKATTRDGGCICNKTKQIIMDRASISDKNVERISVFPNPAISVITMKANHSDKIINVKLFNSVGAIVPIRITQANLDEIKLDVSNISVGMYNLVYELNGDSFSKKIAIQNAK